MSFNWERAFGKTLISCVAVLGLSTSLGAAQDTRTCKEKQPHFAFAYPKDLNLTNPRDFYFYAEGLAFQGMETGLDFVAVNKTVVDPDNFHGKVGGFGQNESWDYNPGVRVGFGFYIDHDAWNFDFDWMWVNITNSESYQAGTGSTVPFLLADGTVASPFTTYGTSGANWGCSVNVVDATLGKPYHISRKLIFNPHFGLRFALIDQDYNVNYGSTTPTNHIKYQVENDFFGVGARFGVNTDWILGCGFKMYSNLSTSLLAGWFDNSQKYTIATPSGENVKLTNKPQVVVPNLELAAGFDWGTRLGNCKYYLDFRAGYEFQIWWDQWNQRQFVTGAVDGNYNSVPTRGDLTMNGFTFKIQLDM